MFLDKKICQNQKKLIQNFEKLCLRILDFDAKIGKQNYFNDVLIQFL
jgi:hypothetical protein